MSILDIFCWAIAHVCAEWIMSWIAQQPGFNKSRHMEVSTRYTNNEGASVFLEDEEKVVCFCATSAS